MLIDGYLYLLQLRDPLTLQHCRSVGILVRMFCERLGIEQLESEEISTAADIHDIGKVGLSDYLINKPGLLTEMEYELVKRHAAIGAKIVKLLGSPERVEKIIRWHHEKFDGSGYPDQLMGTDIPLGARIISLVDVYDTLTNVRSYKPQYSPEQALAIIQREASQFDPDLLKVFLQLTHPKGRNGHHT